MSGIGDRPVPGKPGRKERDYNKRPVTPAEKEERRRYYKTYPYRVETHKRLVLGLPDKHTHLRPGWR